MSDIEHYRALERMYLSAPINQLYKPTISISEGKAEIEVEVTERLLNSAGGAHGSVYFHMLDSAAFFAANSLDRSSFVLTSAFTTYLTRPVSSGSIRAVGTVTNKSKRQFLAESIAYDSRNREIGRGNGIFVRGALPLQDVDSYELN